MDAKDDEEEAAVEGDQKKKKQKEVPLSSDASSALCEWLREALGDKRVREVRVTSRLSGSPAIVTDHESGAIRRMLKLVDQQNAGRTSELPPQILEINPEHPIIKRLSELVTIEKAAAAAAAEDVSTKAKGTSLVSTLVAQQIMDNALIAAGLVDDPRSMLPRLNQLLEETLNKSL